MIIAGLYALVAFTYSFVALASRQPGIHFHEYQYSTVVRELGGHLAFGVIAASPFLDAEVIVLSGLLVIAMDADHILAALNLATTGRPAHSLLFIPATFLFLAYAVRKFGMADRRWLKVAFLAPVVFFSHIAYDIFAAYAVFAGRGASFPLLAPFSFAMISFPYSTWIGFEAGAFLTAAVVRISTFKRHV